MALTSDELQISVTVKSEGAKKAIDDLNKSLTDVDKVSNDAAKGTEKLDGAFEKTTFGVIGLNQALELAKKAMNLIGGEIGKLIDGAIEQEQAEQKVINALRLRGVTSRAVLKDIQAFSAALQANSIYGDEVTMTLVSQALAMGKSLEQSKAMVQASAELASVTGQDLDSAFRMVNQTFSGTTMGLKRLGIDLSGFTQAELEAGAAVEYLNEKLGGSAKVMSQTLGGAIEQAKNAWGDLYETTGTFLVQVVKLDKIFIGITSAIGTTISAVTNFSDAINRMNLEDFIVVLTAVGVAIGVAFGSQIAAAVAGIYAWIVANVALTGSLWAVLAPIGLIALKIVAILGILSAVYLAFKNWELIINLVKRAMYELAIQVNKVIAMVGTLTKFLGKFSATAQKFGNRMETGATKTVKDLRGEVDKLKQEAPKFDSGTFGRAFNYLTGKGNESKESIEDAKKAFDDLKSTAKGGIGAISTKSIDDAVGKFEQMEKSVANVGKTAIEQAFSTYDARSKELEQLEQLLKKTGEYEKYKGRIAKTKENLLLELDLATLEVAKKEIEELEKVNFESTLGELDKINQEFLDLGKSGLELEKTLAKLKESFAGALGDKQAASRIKSIEELRLRLDKVITSLEATSIAKLDSETTKFLAKIKELGGIEQNNLDLKLRAINEKRKELDIMEKQLNVYLRHTNEHKAMLVDARERLKVEEKLAKLSSDKFDPKSLGGYGDIIAEASAGAEGAATTITSAFNQAGGSFIAGVGGIVGAILSIISKIGDLPNVFIELNESLLNIFPKLAEGIPKLAQSLIKLVRTFGKTMFESLGQIIFDFLDQGIDKFADALVDSGDMLARGIEKFIDKIPMIVAKFIEISTSLVPKLIMVALNFLINGVPRIIKALIRALPEIIAAFVVGFIDAIKSIGKMLWQILTGGLKNAFENPASKFITRLSGATEDMFAVIEMGARSKARSSYADAQKELSSMWDRIKGWLKKLLFEIPLWLLQMSVQITTAITGWILGALVWVFEKSNELALWLWQGFVTALTWLVEPFIKWLLDGVTWLFTNTIVKVGEWIFGGINYVFTKLVDLVGRLITGAFTFVFSTLIPAIGNFFVSGFKYIFTTLVPALGEFFKAGFKAVWSLTKDIGNFIVGAFKFAFKELPTNIANFLKGGFTAVFKDLPSAFGNMIYDAFVFVKDKLSKFISGLFSFSNITGGGGSSGGIINTVTSVGGKINPINYIPPTDSKLDPRNWFYNGGLVPYLAQGGVIHAAMGAMAQGDSKLNDRIPAMLSAGELVVPRSGVDNVLDLIRGKKLMPNVAGSGGDTTINMSINITTTEPIDDKYFRNSIMPKVREELRRASLDGRRVLAPSGVR
jgi:hypothetical protein